MFQSTDQFQFIEQVLFETLGSFTEITDFHFLYCGNFNLAARVETPQGRFFVKWNDGDHEGMFEAEGKSLALLREKSTFHVPEVLGYGKRPGGAYLLMEFVEIGEPSPNYWPTFGQQLADLHRNTAPNFGLHFDNYVGAILQKNEAMASGVAFFIDNRLKTQAGKALYEGKISHKLYEQFLVFCEKVPSLIPEESPALLHGDLWSGNVMTNTSGGVTLVDAASYYGLREAEIAFTTMFGGFDNTFYESYNEAFPMANGFSERVVVYNLYPLLVHVNLFGGGYLRAVERILKRFS